MPSGIPPDAEMILFCLPYAGGGASVFRRWPAALRPRIAVRALQLPGRENRYSEPPRIDPDNLARTIAQRADRPYALYGHSMGARLAYEVIRALRRHGAPLPDRLYVGGCHPPHCQDPLVRIAHLPDDGFTAELLALGGTPREVFDHRELRDLVLPVLRSDFTWLARYRHTREPALPIPVVAFAGAADRIAEPTAMLGWAQHTSASFQLHTLPGRHFFLHEEHDRLTRMIAADMLGTRRAPALPDADEVHLYLAALDLLPALTCATGELSTAESHHAAQLLDDADRRRYVGRHVLLRRILRRYGVNVGTTELRTTPQGKPHVSHLSALRFNLSHSDGLGLVAITRNQEVGVDIERLYRTTDHLPLCHGALDDDERGEIDNLPESERAAAALRIWTAKSAILKATGDGEAVKPDRFGFAGQRPGAPWRARVGPDLARLVPWKVTHLPLDGATAAVAVTRPRWRLRFQTITDSIP